MTAAPDTETKSAFARRVGVSPGRVSQWITTGLPLTDDRKRVRVTQALDWLARTLDPTQVAAQRRAPHATPYTPRRAPAPRPEPRPAETPTPRGEDDDDPEDEDPLASDAPADLIAAKTQHEWLKVERARLLLDQTRGNLAPWSEVNKALDTWARAERDAWLSWAARIVPTLAAEIKVEGATLAPALRRAVEDQVRALASEAPPHVGP